jgi:hypothetical protein
MWARDLELALGLWLAVSPFVFAHPDGDSFLWTHDLACAAATVVLALLACGRRTRRAHLLELAIAAWLVAFGWLTASDTPTPASQNHIVVGLLVGMLAIVPSDASRPPRSWRGAPDERAR